MKKNTLVLICIFIVALAKAQDRTIATAVPFLLVAADAKAAGMADQGVATTADAFSQQWNPAKYAFSEDKQGVSLSYTPLMNDVSLGQITYYNRINDRNAFATSLRYYSFGEIELRRTVDPNEIANIVSPNELALDGSYTLKLSEKFSMAVAGRYIRSNLKIPSENTDASAVSSFAIDIAGFYQSEEIAYSNFNGRWRAGFNFQNIGPKIEYDKDKNNANFLPANLRVGGGFDFILDDSNKIGLGLEFSKLLVPTPQNPDLNGDGMVSADERHQNNENYQSINWVSGIFKSFGDAPNGFREEVKEITCSVGAEYMYQNSFAFRLGYFYEDPEKGARKFFSLGTGFKYDFAKIDVSYLFSTSNVRNPLENSVRFSLALNFGDKSKVKKNDPVKNQTEL